MHLEQQFQYQLGSPHHPQHHAQPDPDGLPDNGLLHDHDWRFQLASGDVRQGGLDDRLAGLVAVVLHQLARNAMLPGQLAHLAPRTIRREHERRQFLPG